MDRLPPHIKRDLMRKAAADVFDAAKRTMQLVDHREDRHDIAISCAAMSWGIAIGAVMATRGCSPEAAAESLLAILNPIGIAAVAEAQLAGSKS